MDTKLLKDFICLVQHKSFTVAARHRNITQSALSRRIKLLEQWLGTNLIDRKQSGFSLTPQGRIFAPEAEVLLRRLYNARQTTRVLDHSEGYEINVAAQNSIAQTLFLDWVKCIENEFDNVYVRLLSEKLSECINLLASGHVNYLFCYANPTITIPIDPNTYSYITMGKELLIPVTIPKQNGEPLFNLPGAINEPLPFVAYAHDSVFGRAVDTMIQNQSQGCFLSRRYENPYSHTLKSLVQEKLGLAWLPKMSILTDLETGTLCRAGDKKWDIEFDIRLYYKNSIHSKNEHSLLEASKKMAGNSSNNAIEHLS